ncbi:MAG TPA: lytic transglycosylase domain-containing protein [Puia sp.]|nr:lytic transglycosylase domain-containing protein [Puia sp.]
MILRFLLLIVIVLGLSSTSFGNASDNYRLADLADTGVFAQQASNSSIINKNGNTAASDNGFKDLFVATSIGGSNGARLNPKAVSFVEDYMEKNGKDLQSMKNWGQPYFNLIDKILTKYGLPRELKYLAVIESQLKPTSVSWAGAVGPWQLMPATARLLGLKVSRRHDERMNYYKSTHAAAKYLRDLYNEFGDWLLVIAAYNGGAAHVYAAMHRSHSRNFWDLQYYLPAESRNHVKKFIGTHYIFEGQGGVTTLTKDEAARQLSGSSMYVFNRNISKEELKGTKTIAVSGKYCADVIAKNVLMDLTEFNRYNPDFDKVMASNNNTYDLKLPSDKMDLFVANKYQILNESVQQMLNQGMEENDDKNNLITTVVAVNIKEKK